MNRPRPKEFIKKADCGDSKKGLICGIGVLIVAVGDLSLFFGFGEHAQIKVNKNLLKNVCPWLQ